MAKESEEQRQVVERVMHEFKEGELRRGRGGKVTNPKQAIAIALHEAGASNQQSPEENRKNLARTEAKRRGKGGGAEGEGSAGGETKARLYAGAKRKGVRGRSRMSKAELARAVRG